MAGTDRPNESPLFKPFFYNLNLQGEFAINDFPQVNSIYLENLKISKLKLEKVPNLASFDAVSCNSLESIEGLENCFNLVHAHASHTKLFTYLEGWKQEITQLKAQLAEYEQPEISSDHSELLDSKIQRKKAELSQAITSGRRSTASLRKEIELLEKIQALETQVSTLQTKETGYQEQIREKEQTI